ncbi:hypothetical protein GCM10027269_84060 [Kribbella endophytica]
MAVLFPDGEHLVASEPLRDIAASDCSVATLRSYPRPGLRAASARSVAVGHFEHPAQTCCSHASVTDRFLQHSERSADVMSAEPRRLSQALRRARPGSPSV